LQHTFNDSAIEVVRESAQQSVYRFGYQGSSATIRFTVKGDSFTPVAMSSIIAKYLRERMMQSLNHYFESLHTGHTPLKPTAGYPVDADRYLADIASIIQQHKIARNDLVRQR
jgi:ribonuclease HII